MQMQFPQTQFGTVVAASLLEAGNISTNVIVVEATVEPRLDSAFFFFDLTTNKMRGGSQLAYGRTREQLVIKRLSDRYNNGVVPPIVEIDRQASSLVRRIR